MPKPTILCLALLCAALPAPASATVGGPNSFEVWGVDPKASKLLLRESVGGESGEFRLWSFDLKAPKAAPVLTPLEANGKAPAGLEKPTSLATNEVKLAGSIAAQSLAPVQDSLIQRFDLKVELSWSTARATAGLVAYRTATVQMVGTFLLPGGRCALALISSMGKPEEGGYALQVPVLLCADKPVLAPSREGPAAPPRRPTRVP
ncbi:MAG TPA: hypothetical protein VGK67_34985 [Myxococcales bacterium]|jgi:hypothetical protein